MGILPNCNQVSTIVWLHYQDFNIAIWEQARWELHKDATCCFEQIVEAALYKTAAVQLCSSHFTNHPSKMNKTYWAQQEKQGQTQ